MLNKDKRSLILLLALGDGCLHYIKNNKKIYGGITIDHGIKQADYQSWKAQLLSTISGKAVKMRTGHKGKSVQVSLCMKRIRAWRKFTYVNNKKSIPKILKFIRHPELALSVLMMDDGYVEVSGNKCGGRFRLFLCDQTENQLIEVIKWFSNNFKVNPKIKWVNKKTGKRYPYLKFTEKESLQLWLNMRKFVLQFKSMQYKFRYIEQLYQLKCL